MAIRVLRRIGLGLLAAFAALLLLELVLQAGAWVVALTGRETPGDWEGKSLRIIALGDSNTYGLYLEREQAYPALLERRWNESHESPRLEVINLGYPGNSSSKILRELPQALATYEPNIITLMVGVNDFWTPPLESAGSGGPPSVGGWLREHSRLFKLFYMIRQQIAGPVPALREAPASPDMARLRENLLSIAMLTGERNIELILLTYPHGKVQGIANRELRHAAASAGLELVDIEEIFRPRCATGCDDLLFFDNHPKADGHALIADTIIEALE